MHSRSLVAIVTIELHCAGAAMHVSDLNFAAIQLHRGSGDANWRREPWNLDDGILQLILARPHLGILDRFFVGDPALPSALPQLPQHWNGQRDRRSIKKVSSAGGQLPRAGAEK